MPEMHYRLRWPDGTESRCYSPSLVVKEYLEPGRRYALADFLERARTATRIASDRVRAKFGFACPRAAAQLVQIEAQAARFEHAPGVQVEVIGFEP